MGSGGWNSGARFYFNILEFILNCFGLNFSCIKLCKEERGKRTKIMQNDSMCITTILD